jgi:hypothetical protein
LGQFPIGDAGLIAAGTPWITGGRSIFFGEIEVFAIQPVPLPAAAFLLAPALTGLGVMRRRGF